MLCTEAYTLVTNGDKSGSVLFTINLNVCTNTNKGDHIYEKMSLKNLFLVNIKHKYKFSTYIPESSYQKKGFRGTTPQSPNQFTGYF